ncbi:hypothetical protein ACS0TY_008361 [Phlomoides rotata]
MTCSLANKGFFGEERTLLGQDSRGELTVSVGQLVLALHVFFVGSTMVTCQISTIWVSGLTTRFSTGFGAILVVTTILVLFILTKKKMKNIVNNKNIELFMKQHGDLAPRRYKYLELKKMTKSFSDELGQGGYGRVYKAKSH